MSEDEYEILPRSKTDPFRADLVIYNCFMDGKYRGQVMALDHEDARTVAIQELRLTNRILNGGSLTVRARE